VNLDVAVVLIAGAFLAGYAILEHFYDRRK
jgi:hypothetical protein